MLWAFIGAGNLLPIQITAQRPQYEGEKRIKGTKNVYVTIIHSDKFSENYKSSKYNKKKKKTQRKIHKFNKKSQYLHEIKMNIC